MSSKVATAFGDTYQEDYQKVVSKWSKKLNGVGKISDKTRSEWSADLHGSLGEQVVTGLTDHALPVWKKRGKLPSKEVVDMFAKIAAKGALAVDTGDLLVRLRDSSNVALTAAVKVPEIVKRASQTVSQIFDMAQDRFNALLNKFFRRTDQTNGKRRWVTVSSHFGPSRHASLDGEVRAEGEFFDFEGDQIYGPRPPGGAPAQWSNCSCYLEYLTGNEG